ncbi:MAG TPA: hypothetical protein VGA47_12665 [Candidatus Dormibacteraeota bacterium]
MADRAEMRARMETYVAPLVAGLLALVTLVGLIGPAIQSPAPHDIPVGIVGAPQLAEQLAANAPGAFDFTNYDSEAAARAAIDSRDVDGALVVGPGGPKLIIAGAAGDGVNGVITGVFTNVFKQQGQALAVETVHPFAAGDPHGLILFFVVLAVLVSTLIAQALVGLRRGLRFVTRLSLVVAFAFLAAPTAMGLATWIAGDYGSGFWLATALVALGSAAVGAVVAGAASLLGRPGIALAALIVVLLDLVCSGGPIGSQLLPDAYRWLAPGMPAGQLYSAVRGALYFDGAGIVEPFGVLSLWLLGGLILMVLGQLVSRRVAVREEVVAPNPA